MSELEKNINELFKNNPNEDKVFSTSNGKCFFENVRARNHASSLVDKKVTPHLRKDYVNGMAVNKDSDDSNGDNLDLNALKAEYKELTGNAAHYTWDATKIANKIAEEILKKAAGVTGDTEVLPTDKDTDEDIIAFMEKNGIEVGQDDTKVSMLAKVNEWVNQSKS